MGRGALRLLAVAAAVFALTPAAAQAAWNQPVASSLNISTSEDGQDPQTANVGGTPYVAWSEYNGTANQVYVKRFDGSAWVRVGSLNLDPTRGAFFPSIASIGGVPYVAWYENNGGTQRIFVKRFVAPHGCKSEAGR